MKSSKSKKSPVEKAFTLIELLVVIAIIAILAAILFPVFAQAKMAAKKTVGLSDCKQIALADVMYENDYDDFVVPGLVPSDPGSVQASYEYNPGQPSGNDAFDHMLMPYVKSPGLWIDPGGPSIGKTAAIPTYRNITMNGDAAIDLSAWAYFPNTPVAGSSVQYPSELVLQSNGLAEPQNFDSNYSGILNSAVGACTAWEDQAAGQAPKSYDANYRLYSETANYSMADGHAKSLHVAATLFPNVMWFKERPAAADVAAAPQGAGWFPASSAGPVSPTMDCHTFQYWNGDGGF